MDRLFSKHLSSTHRKWVLNNFCSNQVTHLLKVLVKDRKKITNNSVKLAKLIKESTGIEVFPVIYSRKTSLGMKACGAWSWFMYTINLTEIGCTDSVKDCLTKESKFIKSTYFEWVGGSSELWLVIKP